MIDIISLFQFFDATQTSKTFQTCVFVCSDGENAQANKTIYIFRSVLRLLSFPLKMVRTRRKLFCLVLLVIILIVYCLFKVTEFDDLKPFKKDERSKLRYKIVDFQVKNVTGKKNILFWEDSEQDKNWGDRDRPSYTHKNCVFTHNKQLLNRTYEFDAIVFNPFKKESGKTFKSLPTERSPHQLYILYARE